MLNNIDAIADKIVNLMHKAFVCILNIFSNGTFHIHIS
jgi:hypothetical protein